MNKKAWLRIAEAFMAIMLISAFLVVISVRQNRNPGIEAEISIVEKSILDTVRYDSDIRGKILSGDINFVQQTIHPLIPVWMNYSLNICPYDSVCPNLVDISDREVYSDEVLIVANLTYFYPENATKLKIFLWKK